MSSVGVLGTTVVGYNKRKQGRRIEMPPKLTFQQSVSNSSDYQYIIIKKINLLSQIREVQVQHIWNENIKC